MLSYSPYYPFYSIEKPVEGNILLKPLYLFVVSFESEYDSTGVLDMSLQSLLSEYHNWDVSVINLSV